MGATWQVGSKETGPQILRTELETTKRNPCSSGQPLHQVQGHVHQSKAAQYLLLQVSAFSRDEKKPGVKLERKENVPADQNTSR